MKLKVRVRFEPRDLWVGVYWKAARECATCAREMKQPDYFVRTYHKHEDRPRWCALTVFVCLVPTLPIVIDITRPIWSLGERTPQMTV